MILKKLFLILILIVLYSFIVNGVPPCVNTTGGNVFTFASGGQLINNVGTSDCTHSIANNWANFTCGSSSVNYSIGAGEVWSIDICNEGCTLPYDGLTLTDNTTICRGTYYEDDAANNGMIIINSDRITVNGNKSIIIGDSTGWGIYASSDDTLRIENFTIINYDRGIFLSTGHHSIIRYNNISSGSVPIRLLNSDNVTLQSNLVWDSDTFGIELNTGSDNCTLINNTIINTTNNAIQLDININGTNIYGNRLYNVNDGIFLDRNSSHNTINNNSITKTDHGAYGIHTEDDSSYNIIKNNYGLNMGWNFVDLDSYNNVAYNNWMFNATHHVIDLCNNGNSRKINNNIVYNNFGQQTTSSGIYVCEGYNNNISNNTIIDVTGSGIAIEGNSSELNNTLISLNSVHSVDQYCLYSGSVNSFWNNNILSDCEISEVQVSGYSNNKSQNDNSQFLDNVESNGIMRYYSFSWGNALISINETSTQYHIINLSNGATAELNYNGRKDLSISNNTVTFYTIPENDLVNQSFFNVNNYYEESTSQYNFPSGTSLTIIAGEFWKVGSILTNYLSSVIVKHFNGFVNEYLKFGSVVRIRPAQNMNDSTVRLQFTDINTRWQNKMNETNLNINNQSLRLVKITYSGYGVDRYPNTTTVEPIPFKVIK